MDTKSFASGLLFGVLGTAALGSWALNAADVGGGLKLLMPARTVLLVCTRPDREGRPGVTPQTDTSYLRDGANTLIARTVSCPAL